MRGNCRYQIYVDAGNDKNDALGGVYMGMNWADNAYYIPNYSAVAKVCFTNTPARTSMRAPGVVQSCFATEMIMERIAYELQLPMYSVQQMNFIQDGKTTILGQPIQNCTLPTVWNTLMQRSHYSDRLVAVNTYNSANLWRKRGIAVSPVKYGIGWNGYNAGVRIGVRSQDGSVTLTHSGCEIGQGINTKVAQTVAYALGIPLDLVRVTYTSTEKVANGGVTGGSGTSEVMCKAALNACNTLNSRLEPYKTETKGPFDKSTWVSLLSSLPCDVSLNVEGWYSPTANPNGQPFQYFVYGACVSEVELNVLSGETHVLAAELVYGP